MSDPWPPPPTDPRPDRPAGAWPVAPPVGPPTLPPAAPPTLPPSAAEPDGGAGGRGRRGIILVVAVALALLAAGVAWGVSTAGDDGAREDASARTEDPEPTTRPTERMTSPTPEEPSGPGDHPMMTPTGSDELDAAIADAARFVEEARGLEFVDEVTVEALDAGPFVERLRDEVEGDEEYLEYLDQLGGRLVALGLLSPDGDPVDTYLSLLDQGVLGFYDPESGELVVRGTEPSLFLQSIVVHELTHALDDQHFELDRPDVEENDEHSFGFSALVEGNARTVEDLWVDELSGAEQAQLSAEEMVFGLGLDPADAGDFGDLGGLGELFGGLDLGALEEELGELDLGGLEDDLAELEELFEGLDLGALDEELGDLGLGDLDDELGDLDLGDLDLGDLDLGLGDMGDLLVLQEILMAPYEEGEVLIAALLDEDGMARVDEAYASPPVSSEQVLDPGRYLEGEPVTEVAVPPADGDAVVDGWFGQYFLRLLLESELGDAEVDRATDGWAGDRFVQWDGGGAHCVRVDIATDTAGDREELADALEEWAAEQAEATVGLEGDLVRLTSCN